MFDIQYVGVGGEWSLAVGGQIIPAQPREASFRFEAVRENLRRDSRALYNTGRFSNIAWQTEMGPADAIVRFVVVERPLIESIEYQGDDTVTISEILERFKERKVNLRMDTLYNDGELGRAAATVEELVAEKSRKNITVTPLVESI